VLDAVHGHPAVAVTVIETLRPPRPKDERIGLMEYVHEASAMMVRENCALAVDAGEALSLTWTVKLKVPVTVGVPEIVPVGASVRPAGRAPEAKDHT
jgi:hypothetical protein